MNKVERGMSVLNLTLAHAAIMSGDMAPWAEMAANAANCMATMCTIAVELDKAKNEALACIPALQGKVKASLIVEIIGTEVHAFVPCVTVEASINNVVSRVSTAILEKCGVKRVLQSQEIRGAMEIPTGTAVTRDASLPLVVAHSKRVKTVAVAGEKLHSKWSKSMKEETDAVAEKFARLMTESQSLIVVSCVPTEDVSALHTELKKIDETPIHRCAEPGICCRCLICMFILLITLYQPHKTLVTKSVTTECATTPSKLRQSFLS